MEKQSHQEYRDGLAGKLKEIRNSDPENPEIARAKAQGYLEAKQGTREYQENKKTKEIILERERFKDRLSQYKKDIEDFIERAKVVPRKLPDDIVQLILSQIIPETGKEGWNTIRAEQLPRKTTFIKTGKSTIPNTDDLPYGAKIDGVVINISDPLLNQAALLSLLRRWAQNQYGKSNLVGGEFLIDAKGVDWDFHSDYNYIITKIGKSLEQGSRYWLPDDISYTGNLISSPARGSMAYLLKDESEGIKIHDGDFGGSGDDLKNDYILTFDISKPLKPATK